MTEIHTNYVPLVHLEMVKERFVPYGVDGNIDTPEKVVCMVNKMRNVKNADKEHLLVVSVDAKVKPVCIEVVGIGSLSVLHVEPREIFKHAVLSNASAIIVIHNHPSGDVTPSPDDFKITKRIKKAGDLLGINLLDHIIVGDDEDFCSLKNTQEWEEMKNGSKC